MRAQGFQEITGGSFILHTLSTEHAAFQTDFVQTLGIFLLRFQMLTPSIRNLLFVTVEFLIIFLNQLDSEAVMCLGCYITQKGAKIIVCFALR